jgi:uncharacterized protein
VQASAAKPAFSPSDLTAFLACEHLTGLELRASRREIERPVVDDPTAELIRRKGDEHEARYLADLRAQGRCVVEIAFDHDWDAAARTTEEAIRAGEADVIYQACLVDGDWWGFADFLERQPDGTYEVVDTKLARHAKPTHIFQLCFYTSVLARIQVHTPAKMHLVLGDGRRETFRYTDFDAYYRRIRDRFLDFVRGPPETYPYPVEHCAVCDWRERCQKQWADDDHLVAVANIRRNQIERLARSGITTLEHLGEAAAEPRPAKIAEATFETLRRQAALQLHHRRTQEHKVDQLPLQEKRGFALLPPPDDGDVYFDIEGDPFYSPNGSLEYLFGIAYTDGGEHHYEAFWARDESEEQRAFEQLVDWIGERRRAHPDLHVYHYANYERSALQRLMQKHGTREDEVDDLLRSHALVDLFQVVRQALRISVPSYSLKSIEELFFPPRETDVLGGDESTVVFERWLESGDDALLEQIERYNEDDCRSTLALHAWLLGQRPDGLAWAEPPKEHVPSTEAEEARSEREAVQARLLEHADGEDDRWLAAHLLDYHRRDAKPAWWEYFRKLTLDDQQLFEDTEAIGRIEHDTSVEPYAHKRSLVWELTFPAQEFKLGADIRDPATQRSPGQILEIDEVAGRIKLKRGRDKQREPLPKALVPGKPLKTYEQQDAVLRVARAFADGSDEFRAAQDILTRARPRSNLGDTVTDAALSLDRSYVFVQGPPGSGKTWLGAEAAVELMRAGRRVGVASLSHKAIHKFLDDVVEWAGKKGVKFRGLKKCSERESTSYSGSDLIENSGENEDFEGDDHDLIAGTSWLFARPGVSVDTLFIDEAGQVALADALAIATSARNVVLLGDPNQLPQVSQGAQPKRVRASVLEHLLGEEVTVPPDRGVFLAQTWRLRPEICKFVSDAFYEGRLEPAEVCEKRSLEAGVGLRFVEVEHSGNRVSSPEEAEVIAREIERLLGTEFTDENGSRRALGHDDILVVAPYNAQVRCLRIMLPPEVQVATVDKFQGQQAPVVFFSMTTSSGNDLPRGLEFLFSPNRFNVAISRAQCLAYVVASSTLLLANVCSPEQMRMLNVACRFAQPSSSDGVPTVELNGEVEGGVLQSTERFGAG